MIGSEEIRAMFPALEACPDVLLDNAGGSQVPRFVADAIRDYMLTTYTQLGGDYETSRRSTETVRCAHDFIKLFMNGVGRGEVMLGSSTTAQCIMLADCYRRAQREGRDEIVIAETAHEANAGPWARLADEGFRIRIWPLELESMELRPDALADLLSERTGIVAFPHVSNLLGRIEDAASIASLGREAGARVVVDGVAYAPHRAIDVAGIGADWYVYSTYKVFGPHMAALFGTHEALAELEGPNHFFIPGTELPYKFEPGDASHEGCAGLLGFWPYLATLSGLSGTEEPQRAAIEQAFAVITDRETTLQAHLIEYLRSKPDVRIVGPSTTDPSRVSTVSFVHAKKRSEEIAKAANRRRFGLRYGHFYAYRLCARLAEAGLLHDTQDGVARVSLLHYNTIEEIDRLIDCLDTLL
ncbi:MAG: aminotransferase class V-fold PLP-dependent enzyme [Planctomycetota bacterium]|jgi:cysteine desulfurase family protein (TIGR01976 family)